MAEKDKSDAMDEAGKGKTWDVQTTEEDSLIFCKWVKIPPDRSDQPMSCAENEELSINVQIWR